MGGRLHHQGPERAATALLADKEPQLIGEIGFGLTGEPRIGGVCICLVVAGEAGGNALPGSPFRASNSPRRMRIPCAVDCSLAEGWRAK